MFASELQEKTPFWQQTWKNCINSQQLERFHAGRLQNMKKLVSLFCICTFLGVFGEVSNELTNRTFIGHLDSGEDFIMKIGDPISNIDEAKANVPEAKNLFFRCSKVKFSAIFLKCLWNYKVCLLICKLWSYIAVVHRYLLN